MPKFINNDTLAIMAIATAGVIGILFKQTEIAGVAIGALAGYIKGKENSDNG